jgi:ABC-type molybdate transport system ATPase subunit
LDCRREGPAVKATTARSRRSPSISPATGHIVASLTRMAVDELGLTAGRHVFALIKTVALDERGIAPAGQ